MALHRRVELPALGGAALLAQLASPSAASPIVPVTTTWSPTRAPERCTMVPSGSVPNAVIEIVTGPGRANGVAAEQRAIVMSSRPAPSPRAKAFSQASPTPFGSASVSRKPARLRALGGEIGQVDPQRLLRDRLGRIVGKEMHAADNGVGREHEVVARRRRQQRGVVGQAERAGMPRERLEMPRDQPVLGGLCPDPRALRAWPRHHPAPRRTRSRATAARAGRAPH